MLDLSIALLEHVEEGGALLKILLGVRHALKELLALKIASRTSRRSHGRSALRGSLLRSLASPAPEKRVADH